MVVQRRSCSRSGQNRLAVSVFLVLLYIGFDSRSFCRCCGVKVPKGEYHAWRSTLCTNKSASCDQVEYANVSCFMKKLEKDSSECSDEHFQGKATGNEVYGRMRLSSYLFKNEYFEIPAFNVTFTEIQWRSLRMRFVENSVAKQRQIASCREFEIHSFSNAPPATFTLFFDCLWDQGGYDRKPYHFQYQAGTPSNDTFFYRYAFFVPDHNRIDVSKTKLKDWELFMVVDITEVPQYISVRMQTAPEQFNVSAYRIELHRTLADTSWVVLSWMNNMSLTGVSTGSGNACKISCEEIRCRYATNSRPGIYHFTATVIHTVCGDELQSKCHISKTPNVTVVDFPEKMKLISIVAVVILVPILLTAYFIWRRKCYSNVETPAPVGPPKMLLMYTPVSIHHVRIMMEITKYFISCRLAAILDQFGIPQSEHKDPIQWYQEAFDEADFVGIFASPKTSVTEKEAVLKYTRYLHTESIAQSELRRKLCLPGARCKFFCIALPGTNWDTLPPEAQALKRYTLPRDLDPLLVLVGLAPQCDHGAGFERALAAALAPETPVKIAVPNQLPSSIGPTEEEQPLTTSPLHNNNQTQQQQRTPSESCCPDAFSISDQDLLTSSQPYLSDTGSRTSSLDQFSLLGE